MHETCRGHVRVGVTEGWNSGWGVGTSKRLITMKYHVQCHHDTVRDISLIRLLVSHENLIRIRFIILQSPPGPCKLRSR